MGGRHVGLFTLGDLKMAATGGGGGWEMFNHGGHGARDLNAAGDSS